MFQASAQEPAPTVPWLLDGLVWVKRIVEMVRGVMQRSPFG
jgi:hypothetical protein